LIIRDSSRSPHIVRAGSSTPTKRRKEPFNSFCRYCGLETVYLEAYHAFLCQRCGTIVDEIDPKEEQKAKEQQQEQTYTIADGSQPYHPDIYTRSNIKHGKTFAIPPGVGSGRTMAIRRSDAVAERLRMKDGRSRELDRILQQQDRQMESMGRTILEDRLELRRSSNVKSSDELRAEKSSGTVGLSGAGRYKPATGKRPRLSF
jgi:hypothetical protein